MADEKTTFGAVIEQPSSPVTLSTPQRQSLRPTPSKETELPSTPLSHSSTPGHDHEPNNPFSAFYTHARQDADSKLPPPVYQHEIESQCQLASTKSNVEQTKDCTMWPSRATLKAKKRQEKNAKSWNPLCRLGKKQKLAAQIVIALVIVGAAVGIGVGVSRAVGGGVWTAQGQSKPIPPANNGNKNP